MVGVWTDPVTAQVMMTLREALPSLGAPAALLDVMADPIWLKQGAFEGGPARKIRASLDSPVT
jgi:hypothetical protein